MFDKDNSTPIVPAECFEPGLVAGLYEVNVLSLLSVQTLSPNWHGMSLKMMDAATLAAFVPFSLLKVVNLPRKFSVPPKKAAPTLDFLLNLVSAYIRRDEAAITEAEHLLIERFRLRDRAQILVTVRNWAYLYFALRSRNDRRFLASLSFDITKSLRKALYGRVLRDFRSASREISEESWPEISNLIWHYCQSARLQIELIPELDVFLAECVPYIGTAAFPLHCLQGLVNMEEKEIRDQKGSKPEFLDEQFKAFFRAYGKELAGDHDVNITRQEVSSEGKFVTQLNDNIFARKAPKDLRAKSSVYCFMGFASRFALLSMRKYQLNQAQSSLYALFLLEHVPFFNYQTLPQSVTNALTWPSISDKGSAFFSQASVMLPFLKKCVSIGSPLNYYAWARRDFPKDWQQADWDRVPKNRINVSVIERCSRTFLSAHLTETDRDLATVAGGLPKPFRGLRAAARCLPATTLGRVEPAPAR